MSTLAERLTGLTAAQVKEGLEQARARRDLACVEYEQACRIVDWLEHYLQLIEAERERAR